ncbi:MAG: RagB/SusD family nutrient uptake outer membrane protein [Alistipes sp.]|jgi:hypothetical protein|nr:RagB/SusD family nutrient uptake outer membrane protein [Alistipes sp.]
MKNILIVFSIFGLLLTGCENFLDTESLTEKNTSNYPSDETEVNAELTGIYAVAKEMEMDPNAVCQFVVAEILSDERFAGGGPDDADWAGLEQFVAVPRNTNFFRTTWSNAYTTIFRANTLIANLDLVNWSSAESRNYVEGQAYFLRGYAYLYLARLFGTAPLILSSNDGNQPRATPEALYGQIAHDLVRGAELMPDTQRVPERGRATRWAAQAFIGRAFLFYTGYYDKTEIEMPRVPYVRSEGDAGPAIDEILTKEEVIAYLDNCITASGHGLVSDFRNLWPYSNELTKRDGYAYSVDEDLSWVGETGGNIETIFAWQCRANIDWDYIGGNQINLYFSIREQGEDGIFPFGKGWGFGPVNSELWDAWPNDDLRKRGSIIDVADTREMSGFVYGADNQQHETGYLQKKYIAVNVKTADGFVGYSREMYGETVSTEYALNNTQDLVVMRFADVLLMAAELKEDATTLNRVRARAGLGDVAYTLENLQNERRFELAFEGQRYYDLLRWGLADEALASQNGVSVTNATVPATMNLGDQAGRLAATGGFMHIPEEEIAKSNKVLEQTPGW